MRLLDNMGSSGDYDTELGTRTSLFCSSRRPIDVVYRVYASLGIRSSCVCAIHLQIGLHNANEYLKLAIALSFH